MVLWTVLNASLFLGISFFVNTFERKETTVLWKDKEIHATARPWARLVLYLEMEKLIPSSVHSHCKELASSGFGTQGCAAFSTKWFSFPKAIYQREWGRLDKITVPAPRGKLPALALCIQACKGECVCMCMPASTGCLQLSLKRCHKCL